MSCRVYLLKIRREFERLFRLDVALNGDEITVGEMYLDEVAA